MSRRLIGSLLAAGAVLAAVLVGAGSANAMTFNAPAPNDAPAMIHN